MGIAFVSPMLIGVIILVLFPILATLVLGFADWNFVQGWDGIQWVGFQNFRQLLEDDMFIKSVRNNVLFLLTVPVYMMISMTLAILIDRFVYMKGYFKVAYFMPYISTSWRWPSYGRCCSSRPTVRSTKYSGRSGCPIRPSGSRIPISR